MSSGDAGEPNPTVALRLPREVKNSLEEEASTEGYPNLTELLRAILVGHVAEKGSDTGVSARKQPELGLSKVGACPLLASARNELCGACPYKEPFEPILSREPSSEPDPSTSSHEDLIERLFRSREESAL
jgi:hypothetical protein